jgi:hypothetical protein
MRTLARWSLGALGALVIVGVVIHLPIIRGYLAAHGHHGGGVCPLGYGPTTVRVAHRAPSATEPSALGFRLGVTTADDVMRWSAQRGVGCRSIRGGSSIECAGIPAQLLPAVPSTLGITDAWFVLDDAGTLAAIRTVRRAGAVAAVSGAFDAIEHAITAATGAPTKRDGSAAPGVLARGALRQAMVQYVRPGFRATVRATNMGDGFTLTEDYATI